MVGVTPIICEAPHSNDIRNSIPHRITDFREVSQAKPDTPSNGLAHNSMPVSYTHLTLPTKA